MVGRYVCGENVEYVRIKSYHFKNNIMKEYRLIIAPFNTSKDLITTIPISYSIILQIHKKIFPMLLTF